MSTTPLFNAQQSADQVEQFEKELRSEIFREDAPDGLDTLAERAGETRDGLLALSRRHVVLELAPDLVNEMRGYLIEAAGTLAEAAKDEVPDVRRRGLIADALVEIEALRHILRDGLDHEPLRTTHADGRVFLSRADAINHLERWLPRLTAEQHAELLGINGRSARLWRTQPGKPASRRAELVVELVGVLRHSWTDEGVRRWFNRSHPLLDDRSPDEVLRSVDREQGDEDGDEDWERRLRDAGNATRTQTGS